MLDPSRVDCEKDSSFKKGFLGKGALMFSVGAVGMCGWGKAVVGKGDKRVQGLGLDWGLESTRW